MEELREIINKYGLQEDLEYIIIPLPDKNGKKRRCFLLKRQFIRIVDQEKNFVDYPLADAIEATVRYPDLLLSEALFQVYTERGTDISSLPFAPNKTAGIEPK
ncbi:MAG: hypothetical protein N2511_00720 [Thermodesulfovibrionales bacterium]|nr:hypothetical protein [Thermodesulfovibrionales bacterium]